MCDPARAQEAVELANAGFLLDHTTSVAGMFTGCDKDRQILFQDGTAFTCGERLQHFAFEPKVQFYRDSERRSWLVAIDGRAYAGSIVRDRNRILAQPRPAVRTLPYRSSQVAQPGDLAPTPGLTADYGVTANQSIDPAGAESYPGRRPPSSDLGTRDK